MSTLQAFLLASSLGWSTVAAVGIEHTVAPPMYPFPNYNYTLSHHSVSTFILSTTYPHETGGSATDNVAHLESSATSFDVPTPAYGSPAWKVTQTTESISIPPIAFSPGTKSTETGLDISTPSISFEATTITTTSAAAFVPTSSFIAVPVQDSSLPDSPQSTLIVNHQGVDTPSATPATVTVNGVPVTAGSPDVTISGTTYSLAPSGDAIYVNGASAELPEAKQTGDASSAIQIQGTPIAAGSPAVTIQGATYSLAPSGNVIYVDGAAVDLPTSEQSSSWPDAYDVDGTRVAAGSSAVEIQGTTYSLAPSGDAIYVDGGSISIPTQTWASGQDEYGAAVMSVIGGTRGAHTVEVTIPATGTASASVLDLVAAETTVATSSSLGSSSPSSSTSSYGSSASGEPYVSGGSRLSMLPGLGFSIGLIALALS